MSIPRQGRSLPSTGQSGTYEMSGDLAVYIISTAAELIGIHSRTLYLYEEKGLIVPVRKGNRRFYSANDVHWVHAIRYLVHERGLNLEGLRLVLALKAQLAYQDEVEKLPDICETYVGPMAPCWQEGMARQPCHGCPVYHRARESIQREQGVPELMP